MPGQDPYMPGMLQEAPRAPRKPLGPISLDPELPEERERDVWRCLGEQDETRAARFGAELARGGFPVAAALVNMHVIQLRQVKAIRAAQATREAPPTSTDPSANGKDHGTLIADPAPVDAQ
jgi:hypothetical protein